jgi:FkbM family methyltransferase
MIINDFGKYSLTGWRARLLKLAQTMPANWLGKRLALVCRKLVLNKGPDIIDSSIDQIRFRLHMRDNVSERKFLFLPQFFDNDERALLNQILTPTATFIDIGANAGIYTLTAAAAGARVIAIEPNPAVLERLQFNLAANQLSHLVSPVQKGVSDTTGSFELTLDTSNLGGSSLVSRRAGPRLTIECALLLSILLEEGVTQIDALKIDIEGAEDRALVPFFNTADASLFPKFIIIENSETQWQQDLPALLLKKGYARIKRTRMNSVWQHESRHDAG